MLTPNKLIFTVGGSYVCANFGDNRSRNATVRVLADGYTDTLTDRRKPVLQSVPCYMLYTVAMRQIKITK